MTGNEILARALRERGVDTIFFIMGGPMVDCENACEDASIRMIDVRHEQAAAMMANAYARMTRRPSVCMAASGPGVTNLVTGVANAWADAAPVVAIGGSSPIAQNGMLTFQETDQVAIFKPITRWAERCYDTARIPEYVAAAFRAATGTQPGPVYLDMPGDVLYRDVPDEDIRWSNPQLTKARPHGDPVQISRALEVLEQATKPLIIYGSGILWSEADEALAKFVDRFGIPFWSTPQGRGVIAEDHPLSFLGARSIAFSECDAIVQIGTRQSYVIEYARPPRWSANAKLIQIDSDIQELGRNRQPDVGIVGDARSVLEAMVAMAPKKMGPERYQLWVDRLRSLNNEKLLKAEKQLGSDAVPIHPLRLCREVRDWLPRDAVLVVDGQEILNFARQSIPFFQPRSLNSGPYGCMGVGLPLGIGAKAAFPGAPVVILHGDGSFGMNCMEFDTAVRHNLPVICIISNNGGWSAADKRKAGRDLGFTRYDRMFEPLGLYTKHVVEPRELRAVFNEALASGRPALINVVTDPLARAGGAAFTRYVT